MKTFDAYSDQGVKIVAQDYEMLRPDEHYGRRRAHYFELVPSVVIAGDTIIGVAKIPAGARILPSEILTSGITGATVNVGLASFDGDGYLDLAGTVPDNPEKLAYLLDIAATGSDPIADTLAYGYGYRTEKACWVTIQISEDIPIDTVIKGSIQIVVD